MSAYDDNQKIIGRVAKCHGYIRVKKLTGWGEKFWRTQFFVKSSLFLKKKKTAISVRTCIQTK